jgi:hypothetical protein
MLGTLVNYANDEKVNSVFNAKKTKVVFKEVKKGQQLTVKDSNGVILHLETINKEGRLVKIFDFSKLNDGDYTLELEKDFQIIIKSLIVNDDKVILNENAKQIIFKPVIRNIDNRVMISKIAFNEKQLEVLLYYNDKKIYAEVIKGDAIINRVYRLDENIKGNYTVVVKNSDRSYVNTFEI